MVVEINARSNDGRSSTVTLSQGCNAGCRINLSGDLLSDLCISTNVCGGNATIHMRNGETVTSRDGSTRLTNQRKHDQGRSEHVVRREGPTGPWESQCRDVDSQCRDFATQWGNYSSRCYDQRRRDISTIHRETPLPSSTQRSDSISPAVQDNEDEQQPPRQQPPRQQSPRQQPPRQQRMQATFPSRGTDSLRPQRVSTIHESPSEESNNTDHSSTTSRLETLQQSATDLEETAMRIAEATARTSRAVNTYGVRNNTGNRHLSVGDDPVGSRTERDFRGIPICRLGDTVDRLPCSNDEKRCRICLNDFCANDNVCFLPCAHLFHADCIRGWLPLNATCPTCRTEVCC